MTAIKKLEKVASEGKFLLSHKNHWDRVSGTAGAMLRPKHRLEMADARDCDQEARENRITNQVPAVALESLGLRFWHRRCHAAAEGRAASDAAAEGRAASDAAAGGRWGEQARVIAMKKLERVASEGKFLLSHKHH